MQKSSKVPWGVAKNEGAVIAPEVKTEHGLLMFFASSETRKSRLRENRPQTHPFKAKKVARINISRFLAISAPKSLKIQLHWYVFCDFAIFEEKVRNLEFPGRNKTMLGALFATLRFPVSGNGWKCYNLCFKMIVQIDFRPIACEDGSKKYQYSMV